MLKSGKLNPDLRKILGCIWRVLYCRMKVGQEFFEFGSFLYAALRIPLQNIERHYRMLWVICVMSWKISLSSFFKIRVMMVISAFVLSFCLLLGEDVVFMFGTFGVAVYLRDITGWIVLTRRAANAGWSLSAICFYFGVLRRSVYGISSVELTIGDGSYWLEA